jgi:hypothetical protein
MLPEERLELRNANIYHVPQWDGDYHGWLKQTNLLEIFREVRYADEEKHLLWDLPGHGYAYFDCGKIMVKGCDHVEDHPDRKVFGRVFKRNCRRKQCPICYESWATSEAERALIRFSSFISGSKMIDRLILKLKKKMLKDPIPRQIFHHVLVFKLEKLASARRYRPIHVVLSPPPNTYMNGYDAYRNLRKMAYALARSHGLYGGALIFHPYRLKCSVCGSAIPDYKKQCFSCGSSTFLWFFSPHFHFVGYGWIHMSKEAYSRHGWVIKNLGVRDSLFATFQYLLSHAGVNGNFHTTTWFGKLAYNLMGMVPKVGSLIEICPFCRRPLMPLLWIGGEDRPPPKLEYSDDPFENHFLGDPLDWRSGYHQF